MNTSLIRFLCGPGLIFLSVATCSGQEPLPNGLNELRTIETGWSGIHQVAISPDSKRVAAATGGGWGPIGYFTVWDAATGKKLLDVHAVDGSYLFGLAFSPDGKRIATAGGKGSLRLWDATSGKDLRTLKVTGSSVNSVAFSGDGRRLVSAGGNGWTGQPRFGEVKLWDAATGKELAALGGHRGEVRRVGINRDGSRVVTCDSRGVRAWDGRTARELFAVSERPADHHCAAVSPDGKRVVTGGWDQPVRVWDTDTGKELRTLRAAHALHDVTFSPDGRWLLGGGYRSPGHGWITAWEVATGKTLFTRKAHDQRIVSVAVSPDGKRLATAANDAKVILWELK